MRRSTYILILFIGSILLSCNKYEEGSNFSLLSARARFINTWNMRKAESTYQDVTSDITTMYPQTELQIYKSGGFSRILTTQNGTFSDEGSWVLNDDRTKVILKVQGQDDEEYEFVRLKNKTMKWRYQEGSVTYTIEFTGK